MVEPGKPLHNRETRERAPPNLLTELLRTRRFVQASMLLFALTVGAITALLFFSVPRQQVFGHAISLKFAGAEQAAYPNGLPFSIGDLVAPAVISKVYEDNRLSTYGIDRAKFAASVSVIPYAPLLDEINDRYLDRLKDKKLSFVERQQVEKQMREELDKESIRGVLIRFHHDGRVPLDKAYGAKIVHDIAAAWADHMVKRMGALQVVDQLTERPVIDIKSLEPASELLSMTLLASGVARLDTALRQVRKVPGINTVVAPESQSTTASIDQALEGFEVELLSLPISTESRKVYFERRKAFLEAEKQTYLGKSTSVQSALNYYLETDRPDSRVSDGNAPVAPSPGSGYTTQFDSSYVDRVVTLSEKAFNQTYRRELSDRQIELRNRAAEVDSALRRFGILAQEAAGAPQVKSDAQSSTASLLQSAGRLNAIGVDLSSIAKAMTYTEMSPRKQLYADAALPSGSAYSARHPLFEPWIISAYLAGILGSGLLAAAAGMAWQFLQRALLQTRE